MPKRSRRTTISLDPLPFGLGTKIAEHRNATTVIQMDNWWPAYGDMGSIQVMPGFDTIGGMSSLGAGAWVRTIRQVEKSSTEVRRWFIAYDTSVAIITDPLAVSVTPVVVKGGLTISSESGVAIAEFDDLVLFYTGNDAPFLYDFSSDTASAISDAALTRPTLGSFSATPNGEEGNVKGVHQYFVSYMSGTTELALSTGISIDAGNGQIVDLANIPTGGGGVTARRIYRTIKDRSQPLFLASIDDNSTTIFEDNIKDTALGAVPPNHGEPAPNGANIALVHFNRVWIAGMNANEVWWSDLNNGRAFNPYSFLNVFEKDGDKITALSRFKDGLIVWKHNHAYKVIGHDPDAEIMDIVEIKSSDPRSRAIGTPSQGCVTSCPVGHIFYFNKGFYLLDDGCSIQYISREIEDELKDDLLFDYNTYNAQETKIKLEYWADRRAMFCSVPVSGSTENNRTYVYWLDYGKWTRITTGFTAMATGEVGNDGSAPSYWVFLASERKDAPEPVYIHRLDHPTAKTFDGSSFNAVYHLGPIVGANPTEWHQWLYAQIHFAPITNEGTTVSFAVGGESVYTDVAVDFTKSGVDRWSKSVAFSRLSPELNIKMTTDIDTNSSGQPIVHGLHVYANNMGIEVRR